MEPFRHLVERQALTLLKRRELKPGDFLVDDRGCRLSRPALRHYLSVLSARFIAPMEDAAGHEGALHDHLWRLSRALIARIDGHSSEFTPFRLR
jgi:CRISPR/Cas system-associated endonuclease Cas1